MGYVKFDTRLYGYLDRSNAKRDRPIRNMTSEELERSDILRKRIKDMAILITEMITIRNLLRTINEPKLFYIQNNINRIMFSVVHQRDFAKSLRRAFMTVQPMPYEEPLIKDFISRVATRIDFLRGTIIPENLLLTPIQEYLEIIGEKDFTADINAKFGNRTAMFDANTGKNDEIEHYAADILLTVHEHGLDDKYRERLNRYIEMENRREENKKQERKAEKDRRDMELMKDGMDAFQRMFNKGIRTLKGCETIKMGFWTIEKKISEYGRDGYVLLCVYVHNNKCVYRYGGEKNDLVPTFYQARIFKDGFEATDAMAEMEKKYPDRLFDVIRIDYSREELEVG